jgi:pyruvate-formate lyase-activating enzyme
VGTPNVIMLGGGHFGRFMPYSPLTSTVCLPLSCYGCNWRCRHARAHCVQDVAPEVVEVALREALERGSPRPRLYLQHWSFAPGPPDTEPFFNVDMLPPMLLDATCVVPEDAPEVQNRPPALCGCPLRYLRVARRQIPSRAVETRIDGVTPTGGLLVSFGNGGNAG